MTTVSNNCVGSIKCPTPLNASFNKGDSIGSTLNAFFNKGESIGPSIAIESIACCCSKSVIPVGLTNGDRFGKAMFLKIICKSGSVLFILIIQHGKLINSDHYPTHGE